MYRALYRKYRPKDFSGVCGQPQVVRTLVNQLNEGHLSHAYLFTGSRGTGKTSCAKILAKAVNCLHPTDGNPCNECEICRGIDDESILDVTEIDAASNNGVDDIRELRDNSAFTPASAKYRVYIIDEVHMLSGAAFNALLKTLEEPPEHVLFILATTEVHKLPATILSRCQRFDFRRISPDDIADRLEFVASQEDFTITRDAALLIGKLADGAMRDALSLLDVCSSAGEVTEQTVLDCAGLSGRQYLADLLGFAFSGDCASALNLIDELYTKAKDLGRLCTELTEYLRDMMLVKSLRKPEALVRCPSGELEQLRTLCGKVRLDTILHAIDLFEQTAEHMRSGAERRTAVETAVIKLCDPSLDASAGAMLRRIAALESGGALRNAPAPIVPTAVTVVAHGSASATPASFDSEPSTPAANAAPTPDDSREAPSERDEIPLPDAPPESGAPASVDPVPASTAPIVNASANAAESASLSGDAVLYERWNDVIAAVGKTNHLLKAALGGSRAYIRDDYMLIDIANESFRDMINNDSHHRSDLKAAIAAVTGRSYRIGPYKAPRQDAPVRNDPLDSLIASAMENGVSEKP